MSCCDEQRNYKGSISTKKLINVFSKQSGFNRNGAVITLLVNDIDYQLSQIAQIVESNGAKIISLYSEKLESNNQLKLTIKISDGKLGAILQTFSGTIIQFWMFLVTMKLTIKVSKGMII